MKKLLILLLLPLFSFSQTFDELMTINSEDTFMRVAIENDYEFYEQKEEEKEDNYIYYAWGLNGDKAEMWAIYSKDIETVLFQFNKDELLGHKPIFKEITKNIKSKCEYDRIDGEKDFSAAFYKCPEYLLLPTMMEDERITKDGYQYKYIEGKYYSRPVDAGPDVRWTELTNESGKEIGFYTSDGTGFVILMF